MARQTATQKKKKILKDKNSPYVKLDDDNLIVTLSGKAESLRDERNSDIDELVKWFLSTVNQVEHRYKVEANCWICGIKLTPEIRELNHIAGKKHDYRLNTLCIPCHLEFTEIQLGWGSLWYQKDLSEKMRRMFLYKGIREILILKSKESGNDIYEKFARKLNRVISNLIQENEFIQREDSDQSAMLHRKVRT